MREVRRDAPPVAGTVQLRSGVWKWTAYHGADEVAILFHDEKTPNNRMRSRLLGSGITDEAILQAAREPECRWWEDPVGGIWEIQIEVAPSIRAEQRVRPRQRIIFGRQGEKMETELPEGRTLGELSAVELAALLYESTERGSP